MAEPDCSEAAHQLYHYLDGELTDEVRTKIAQHLDDCPPCKDGYDFELDLRILIATRCRENVPEELRVRIAQAIKHEHHQQYPG